MENVGQLERGVSSMHGDLGLIPPALHKLTVEKQTSNLKHSGGGKQEDQKFKVNLSYIINSKPVSVFKQKNNKNQG